MKNFLKIFSPREKAQNKPLEAIQIEVSALCNLRCVFCPTTYLQHQGNNMMELELFKKMVPYFSWSQWVYLQGWGEPLLNRHFWQMVELAKATGVKVGFTTCGTLLNEKTIENVFKYQVDLISTSIAGATKETHDSLRVGSDFSQIVTGLKQIVEERKARRIKWPKLSLSYMLTKDNIGQLVDAVELAIQLGADDFYAINLDYVFNEHADHCKTFSWEGETQETDGYKDIISQARKVAGDHNFSFRFYKVALGVEEAVCELRTDKFVFITVNGDVTPCTYLGRLNNPRVFKGEHFNIPKCVFGNLNHNSFQEIWESPRYTHVRRTFANRQEALEQLLADYMEQDHSLVRMKFTDEEYARKLAENPLPDHCKICPKMYGI